MDETVSVGSFGWENIRFEAQGGELIGQIAGDGPLSFTAYINARTIEYQGEILYDWCAEGVTQANFENLYPGNSPHTLSIYNPNWFSVTVHARITETLTLRPYRSFCNAILIFSLSILLPAGLVLVVLSQRKTRSVQE